MYSEQMHIEQTHFRKGTFQQRNNRICSSVEVITVFKQGNLFAMVLFHNV